MQPVHRRSSFLRCFFLAALPAAVALQFITSCDSSSIGTPEYTLPSRYFKDSVQAIFEEKCYYCHGDGDGTGYFNTGGGESGWIGLDLTNAHAYASLVGSAGTGVPSYERQFKPDSVPRLRVKPGFPDSSYLYHKVSMDNPGYGGRMPLFSVQLEAGEIAVIRKWIQYGAPLGDTTTH